MRNLAWKLWLVSALLLAAECSGHNHVHDESLAVVREMYASKRSLEPLPRMLSMHVHLDNRDPFLLALTRTRRIQPHDIMMVLDEPIAEELQGREREFKVDSAKMSAFYANKERTAILSVTHNQDTPDFKRTLFGTVILNGETYEIRPYPDTEDAHALSSRGLDQGEGHMLHTMKRVQLPTQPHDNVNYRQRKVNRTEAAKKDSFSTNEQLLKALQERTGSTDLKTKQSRQRRQATGEERTFDVELTFLLEYTIFQEWMEQTRSDSDEALEGIHQYYAHIYHGMYLAYADISDSYDVDFDLWLKVIHVATTRGASNYVTYLSASEVDVYPTFAGIEQYMRSRSLNWLNTDHLMMWSRFGFGIDGDDGILGITRDICGVCTSDMSMTLNRDYGLFSYRTGAHELGHNLGAHHDEDFRGHDCDVDDLYLMTPAAFELTHTTVRNSYTFSECSVAMMVGCLHGTTEAYESFHLGPDYFPARTFPRTCVLDTPEDCVHGASIDEILEVLPGEMFDIDEQCKLATGVESAFFSPECQENESESICSQLWCVLGGDPGCGHHIAEMNAVAGTPCNTGFGSGDELDKRAVELDHVCWKGSCVPEGSFNYTRSSLFDCPDSAEIEVPEDCEDQEPFARCLTFVYEQPWSCFSTMKYACAATCTQYGLFLADDPPCDSEPVVDSEDSWQYELCGYDMWDGYFIMCPNEDYCVPMWYFGDAWPDCDDEADEEPYIVANVPSGFPGYVRCPGNLDVLIPEEFMCDEYEDCEGGGDELQDNCDDVIPYCDAHENYEINCPNNPRECIPIDWLCDEYEDCGVGDEASDEDPRVCDVMQSGPAHCHDNEFACTHAGVVGRPCIGEFEVCDGFHDCYTPDPDAEYSEDEDPDRCGSLPPAECASDEFLCPEAPRFCLPDSWICDGLEDCYGSGYDEEDCDRKRFIKNRKNHDRASEKVQLCAAADGQLVICDRGLTGRSMTKHSAQAKMKAQLEFAMKLERREKKKQLAKMKAQLEFAMKLERREKKKQLMMKGGAIKDRHTLKNIIIN